MSRTNCFLPNSGLVLNFRVRIVNSLMAAAGDSMEKGGATGRQMSSAARTGAFAL